MNNMDERAAILQTDREWLQAAEEAQDIERIISFWSDDAQIYVPAMPVIAGKEAIRNFVKTSLAMPGFTIRWNTKELVVSRDGTLAYATGTNVTTFHDPQGNIVTVHGKGVTVWRKESFGAWKCVIDIWNDDPQPR